MQKTYTEQRPWGKFERFSHNELSTVKIIYVNPGEEISLQYHEKRDEFWKILEGNPTIIIGDKTIKGKAGDEFFIQRRNTHRIMSDVTSTKILEIAFGNFDEQDIIRLDDKYKRT